MATVNELKSKNYYEILNVSRDASTDAIKESYKEIAKIYHPDSNYYADIIAEPLSPEQEEIFKIITAAYNTLISPEKRKEYDQAIAPMVDLSINLKSWEDKDEFWDYRTSATSIGAIPSRSTTVKRTTSNLKNFGKIHAAPPPPPKVEEEIEEEQTNYKLYLLYIVGALFFVSGAVVLYLVLR